MVDHKIAIATRAAPSFLRVGHIQVMERRVRRDLRKGGESLERSMEELTSLVNFVLMREFEDIYEMNTSLGEKVLLMLRRSSAGIAKLTANWIRVGFVQGNFNSDNCLIAGRTMDYGPFGFIEKFEPYWNMWLGGGQHFGFLNQPIAGWKNFLSLVKAVEPLLTPQQVEESVSIGRAHEEEARVAVMNVWREKLGFAAGGEAVAEIMDELIPLLSESNADYTIFWRQLAYFPENCLRDGNIDLEFDESRRFMTPIEVAFYTPRTDDLAVRWHAWLRNWLKHLAIENRLPAEISASMRSVSPKYVPREWILVDAYTKAENGDYSEISRLMDVFADPYSEQSGMMSDLYYVRAPTKVVIEGVGGTSYMT